MLGSIRGTEISPSPAQACVDALLDQVDAREVTVGCV